MQAIRNALKMELDPGDAWFSLESASDPGRFPRHFSLFTHAHKKAELTPWQAALFPVGGSASNAINGSCAPSDEIGTLIVDYAVHLHHDLGAETLETVYADRPQSRLRWMIDRPNQAPFAWIANWGESMTHGSLHSGQPPDRFSISSLLLTIALIAVCLAVGRAAPLLGVALALLAAPAYIRTALAPRSGWRYSIEPASALQPFRTAADLGTRGEQEDESDEGEPRTAPRRSAIGHVLVFAESVSLFLLLGITAVVTFAAILAVFLTVGVLLERYCEPYARGVLLVCLISGLSLAAVTAFGLSGWLGLRLWPVRISLPGPRR